MICGEGNSDAPIMIILDNPGAREDREGNPNVCGTYSKLFTRLASALKIYILPLF